MVGNEKIIERIMFNMMNERYVFMIPCLELCIHNKWTHVLLTTYVWSFNQAWKEIQFLCIEWLGNIVSWSNNMDYGKPK